jgi:hypothetical protein
VAGQFAAVEVARSALVFNTFADAQVREAAVAAEEEAAVDPFEIEPHRDRRHDLWQGVVEFLLDDAAVADGREVVPCLPAARVGLRVHVKETFLEGFEQVVGVAIVVEPDGVEIP